MARRRASVVAMTAVAAPTARLLPNADRNCGLSKATPYQRSVYPCMGKPTISEVLNDRTVIITSGP